MTQKIKWLLFHEPAELFIRTAKDFQKHLDTLTEGKFKIEILTLDDYQDKYLDGTVCDPFVELQNGNIQISQIYADIVGSFKATDFYALSMPYLFQNHEHATKVFEGTIGQQLFDHLYEKTSVRGLSYTYSGGYRCTASNSPIRSIKDFANKTFHRETNPILADMIKLVKSIPSDNVYDKKEKLDLQQTTYPRYHADTKNYRDQVYVSDTRHSMYLTAILMNDEFWTNLNEQDKKHFKEAGLRASRTERIQSVADAEKIKSSKDKQNELGIKEIVEWPEDEINKLKDLWSPLYEKYENFFTFDVLNQIKKLH